MAPKRKGPPKGTRSGPKFVEAPLTSYEIDKMNRCLRNNARMRQLGLPALARLISARSTILQEPEKNRNNDDPDFDCNPEVDAYSDGDLGDDSLVPETEVLEDMDSAHGILKHKPITSKKNSENVLNVPPQPTRGKRVVAPMIHGRLTRSAKVVRPQVPAAGTEAEFAIQATSEVQVANTQGDGPTLTVHNQEGIDQHNDCHIDNLDEHNNNDSSMNEANEGLPNQFEHTLNDTNMDETVDDDSEDAYEEEWTRGPNVGIGLDRMSRSKRGKLSVVIEPGKIRPNSVKIAAKFATECNIAVRNHVPIFPRWKDYKEQKGFLEGLLRFYIKKVGSKFDMDTTAAPVKRACVVHLKRAIRQQRYKLKKKYFDPYPLHLVLKTSPVSTMSDPEWIKLVEHWKDEKKMLTCEKNKANRAKVQFHQTTGSRSYEMHIIHLGDKYKEAPPDALDMFKEFHNSKKKGIAPAVQSAIAEMETKIAEPVEDGREPKSVNDVVSEVLLDKTKKNQFLQNVGINKGASGSSAASQRELQAELVAEKQTSSDLRDLVNIQRQQLDQMVKKQQAAEEERAKHDEEMKQRQVETDALLRRLMAMIPGTQATR